MVLWLTATASDQHGATLGSACAAADLRDPLDTCVTPLQAPAALVQWLAGVGWGPGPVLGN